MKAKNSLRTRPLKERFLARIFKNKLTGCWEWQGSVNNCGYGRIGNGWRTLIYTHRFSYEMHIGPIPEGMQVLHHCDNPRCANPDHLFLGTQKDNVADMMKKKRNGHGDGRCTLSKGSKNGSAKLNEEKVAHIKSRILSGDKIPALAREFGVAPATIRGIRDRKVWRHV